MNINQGWNMPPFNSVELTERDERRRPTHYIYRMDNAIVADIYITYTEFGIRQATLVLR